MYTLNGNDRVLSSDEDIAFVQSINALSGNLVAIKSICTTYAQQAEISALACKTIDFKLQELCISTDKVSTLASAALNNLASTGDSQIITKAALLHKQCIDYLSHASAIKLEVSSLHSDADSVFDLSRSIFSASMAPVQSAEGAKVKALDLYFCARKLKQIEKIESSKSESAALKIVSFNSTANQIFVVEAEKLPESCQLGKSLGEVVASEIAADAPKAAAQLLVNIANGLAEKVKSSALSSVLMSDIEWLKSKGWLNWMTKDPRTDQLPLDANFGSIIKRQYDGLVWDMSIGKFNDVSRASPDDIKSMAGFSGGKYTIPQIEAIINVNKAPTATDARTFTPTAMETAASQEPLTTERITGALSVVEDATAKLAQIEEEKKKLEEEAKLAKEHYDYELQQSKNAKEHEDLALLATKEKHDNDLQQAKKAQEEAEAKAKLLEAQLAEAKEAKNKKELDIVDSLPNTPVPPATPNDFPGSKLPYVIPEAKLPSEFFNQEKKQPEETKKFGMKPLVAAGIGVGAIALVLLATRK
jgi:hypothetical protein